MVKCKGVPEFNKKINMPLTDEYLNPYSCSNWFTWMRSDEQSLFVATKLAGKGEPYFCLSSEVMLVVTWDGRNLLQIKHMYLD